MQIKQFWAGALALALLTSAPASARLLDDFNDNVKTDWSDFTFMEGFGLPVETSGQFRFELPPTGQQIFTASQKTSENFVLQEGRTIEFRVDVVQAGGQDSLAVLAFIPNTPGTSPGTLTGYGMAKSTGDVVILKGLEKYFIDDDSVEATELKNENITLVLRLSVAGGNVIITGKVLDKDANDAVIWERTFVDTPGEDVLETGQDSPGEPHITSGYCTLYCFQDFDAAVPEDLYFAYFDNARSFVSETTVLDDFDDNTKTDWADFTFLDEFGIPEETSGQFRFEQPPAGQQIFSASQKTSRQFELADGERLEFRVDLMEGGAKDSFAVLGFIPNTGGNSPGTLNGYTLAKSTTDVLITKSVNKYFVADDGPDAELKNENVTLVLSMEGKDGNVIITGRVLDLDDDNAVIWEQTVVDTPEADVLEDGEDDPAAPWLTTGYFTLYCFQDFDAGAPEDPYKVYFDNAVVVAAPVAENTAPIISEVDPQDFSNFLPASTEIAFKVADDKPLPKDRILVTLNGASPEGIVEVEDVDGEGKVVTYKLSDALESNRNYVAELKVTDSEGRETVQTLYFDTFENDALVVEVEDYNYDAGSYLDDPVLIPEGAWQVDSYSDQFGEEGIDFHDTRTAPDNQDSPYRTGDPVRMQRSRDFARAKYVEAGGAGEDIYDYDVIDIETDEWLNYTKTFTAGSYQIYLRQAVANMSQGESILELVTSDPSGENQTTEVVGVFLAELTGFQYRNFPLTDASGLNPEVLRLSGKTTLRLRQVTADAEDGSRMPNYLVFIPVGDEGVSRPAITSLTPAADSTVDTLEPVIQVVIQNRDTAVRGDSIELEYNGETVSATVTPTSDGATVDYSIPERPPSGAVNTARVSFVDSDDVEGGTEWSFVISYKSLDPANRQPGPGEDTGFTVRVVQAAFGLDPDDNLARAEEQLAPDSSIESEYDLTIVDELTNYSQNGPGTSDGSFPDDAIFPGLDELGDGDDNLAMEILTYLELEEGTYTLGVHSDDGYKIEAVNRFTDRNAPLLAFRNGSANETFDLVVPQSGFYPFRVVWYEGGGGAHFEWFSVDSDTGQRVLINAPGTANALKAYVAVEAPALSLESSASVAGGFAVDTAAIIEVGTWTITIPMEGEMRFYRLVSPDELTIGSIRIEGSNVVLTYE